MRQVILLCALISAPFSTARAEPVHEGARILKAVKRPFQAAGGALRLAKIALSLGSTGPVLKREKLQPDPGKIVYRRAVGIGLYAIAEELKARADLTGKTVVTNFSLERLEVRPGTPMAEVFGAVAIQVLGK